MQMGWIGWWRESEGRRTQERLRSTRRKRERQRDRETETESESERRERESKRERERERERLTEKEWMRKMAVTEVFLCSCGGKDADGRWEEGEGGRSREEEEGERIVREGKRGG
jgi:hypothetical protein